MAKKKSADKSKSKKSSKKSPDSNDQQKRKSGGKPKSADQGSSKTVKPTQTSGDSSGKVKPTSKDKNSNKSKSAKSYKANAESSDASLSAGSGSNLQLEKCRKRLHQLNAEHRTKVDEEIKKFERLEEEQSEGIREQNQAVLEKKVKQLQDEYRQKIDSVTADLVKQQQSEMAKVKGKEAEENKAADKKGAELEKEIAAQQEETEADIERYRKKRVAEKEEQVRRIEEQCEADIKDYTNKRMETNSQLIEQIKQKFDLEIKNDKQKTQLKATLKKDKVKEQLQKTQAEETDKLNQSMAQAIAEFRARNEQDLSQALANNKKSLQNELDQARTRLDDKFRKERTELEKTIESIEDTIKGKLKQHQRELERRTKMKQELLEMLKMDDTVKITDEEFITSRYHYKIERNQIVVQSEASTIYKAKKENSTSALYCKVTMLDKWSTRHRADFAKSSTRLIRYLTANHSKAPFFVKMLEVLATDSKLYSFIEPLPNTKTLISYLESKAKKSRSDVGWKKAELLNVLSQVVKGICFLNHMFVAHANLSLDNITLLVGSNTSDLSECKLVLTGLTRPIVFYNVESDQLSSTKGFDISMDDDSIDHLPVECFEAEFQANALDAYSIGVLACSIVQLRSPFVKSCGTSKRKILAAKQADSVKLEESGHLASLVASLTVPQPGKRFSVDDILNHAYFRK